MNKQQALQNISELREQGKQLAVQGDWQQAEYCYQQALELFNNPLLNGQSEIDEILASLLMDLAFAYHVQNQLDKAIKYNRLALALYETSPLKETLERNKKRLYILINLSLAYRVQGKLEEAIPIYQLALALFKRSPLKYLPELDESQGGLLLDLGFSVNWTTGTLVYVWRIKDRAYRPTLPE